MSELKVYRLADKEKKLNVNVVMGVQNVIAIAISVMSKFSMTRVNIYSP